MAKMAVTVTVTGSLKGKKYNGMRGIP